MSLKKPTTLEKLIEIANLDDFIYKPNKRLYEQIMRHTLYVGLKLLGPYGYNKFQKHVNMLWKKSEEEWEAQEAQNK
jgi:hypothetical protein